MAITPRDLLQFASDHMDAEEEVDRRAAASRAYYAAYHQCLLLSNQLPPEPSTPSDGYHAKLAYNLRNNTHPDQTTQGRVRQLGESLKQLKTIRTRADYYLRQRFKKNIATQAHRQGVQIVENALELDQLL